MADIVRQHGLDHIGLDRHPLGKKVFGRCQRRRHQIGAARAPHRRLHRRTVGEIGNHRLGAAGLPPSGSFGCANKHTHIMPRFKKAARRRRAGAPGNA